MWRPMFRIILSLNLRIGGGAFGKSLMLNAGGNSLRPFLPPLLVKSASAAEHAEPQLPILRFELSMALWSFREGRIFRCKLKLGSLAPRVRISLLGRIVPHSLDLFLRCTEVSNNKISPKITYLRKLVKLTDHAYACNNLTSFKYAVHAIYNGGNNSYIRQFQLGDNSIEIK